MTTTLSPSSLATETPSTLQYLPEYMLPEPATMVTSLSALTVS